MKRGMLILTLFVLAFAGLFAQAQSYLFVITDWPPYEYSKGSTVSGVDIEILQAAFRHMGLSLRIENYPWERCVAMVQSKDADGTLTLSKNADRMTYLIYPEQPIDLSENVLFILKTSKVKFDSYDDLKGLTIGTSSGYSYGNEFNTSTIFTKQEANDDATNLKKLAGGRIDAFVCDKLVGMYLTKQLGLQDTITYLPKTVASLTMYVGFSMKPGASELAAKFDSAILGMKKSGEYQTILDKYIK